MKTSLFCLISLTLFTVHLCYSQPKIFSKFGEPSPEEFAMEFYEKDSTAAVVILYDQGFFEYEMIQNQLALVKTIYKKIKVFDSNDFDRNIDNIHLLASNETSERMTKFKGHIHRNNNRIPLAKEDLLPTYLEGIGNVVRVLIPPVEDGDIIEYFYRIESPFLFNLDGWSFQGEFPKLYSEVILEKPDEISFNNAVYGNEEMYLHAAGYSENCYEKLPNGFAYRCANYLYAMKDVPAFRMEEHMLSPKNYLARIEFEPETVVVNRAFKQVHKFSRKWRDVDRSFKKNELFGKEFRDNRYLKSQIPDSIMTIQEDLARAKAVYDFIRDRFTWNGILYNYGATIKDVYEDKEGSAAEINISLINALQASGLDAKLMMISTRENGLPTTLHPVITKFNYAIVYLEIADDVYLMDATDKLTPFGMLPFYTLNVQGRVMDYKRSSFWAPITPYKHNILFVKSSVEALPDGKFKGDVNYTSSGYIALDKRKIIDAIGVDAYIQELEYTEDHREIRDYQINDIDSIDTPITEEHSIEFRPEEKEDTYLLYPFYNHLYFEENPFTMEERSYPIDFGFPFSNTYMMSIDLDTVYSVDEMPQNKIVRLPGNDGLCSISYSLEGETINVHFNFKLDAFRFQPEAYDSLKKFFEYAVDALKNDVIILKKKAT